MLPIDELKSLDLQIESTTEVDSLKTIYERLGDLARQHPGDFDLQLAVAEVRQHVIEKGLLLRRPRPNGSTPPVPAPRRKTVEAAGRPPVAAPSALRPARPLDIRRALVFGAGLGVAAWLIIFVVLVQIARNRNLPRPAPGPVVTTSTTKAARGTVAVDIVTSPPGAAIQINGEAKCKSNCQVNLPPGNYQVTALLDGFDPLATGVTVVPGNLINVTMKLISQTQTVKVLTDLESGRVILDGKPVGDLQDGQLVLDRVVNGKHSVRVIGKSGDAGFSFEGASGKPPSITGPVSAVNVFAVLVSSLGNQARIQSSSQTPVKVMLNGQPAGDAGPLGLDLKDVPAGDQTLTIGDGQTQRKLVVSFGPMPVLTAFLKSDINTGTLVVTTGEDDVSVFLNGSEYKRRTHRGELRLQTVGVVAVHVAKPGFQAEPEQRVDVKKGEETKVAFRMRPLPKVAALRIRNGVPGTQVLVDDRPVGQVGPDGNLSAANLAPGEHAIEIRREGFISRRILRTLKPGDTMALTGAEIVLPASTASVHLTVSPPGATVTYHRADESQSHAVRDSTLKLDPGTYVFTARAPEFVEHSERATVAAGESKTLEIALVHAPRPVETPKPKTAAALNWSGWSKDGSSYVRRGGNRVVLHAGELAGTITFTAHLNKGGNLFRAAKLRWFIEDQGGYSQFELDKKKFQARSPDGARSREHSRDRGEGDERTYTVQIELTADHIVHRMKVGDSWITLDTEPAKGLGEGKFGFVIPGGDEVAISDLNFTPK